MATVMAPGASLTAIIDKLMIPHAKVQGTRRLNTPMRSAMIVGSMRPNALDPLSIAIYRKVSQHRSLNSIHVTYYIESQRGVNAVFDRVKLEE
jgi:hypothetical protein